MKRIFANRSLGFYLLLASGLCSLLAAFIYLIYTLNVGLYVSGIFILALAGGLSCLLALTGWEFVSWVPLILESCAFAYHLYDRVEMFAYMATGVYGMGETGAILPLVILILVVMLLAIFLAVVASFLPLKKTVSLAPKAE